MRQVLNFIVSMITTTKGPNAADIKSIKLGICSEFMVGDTQFRDNAQYLHKWSMFPTHLRSCRVVPVPDNILSLYRTLS